VLPTRLWSNLHQVRHAAQNQTIGKPKIFSYIFKQYIYLMSHASADALTTNMLAAAF